METVSPRLTSWISSRSWRFPRSEAMRCLTKVRGSAIPVPRKIVMPGLIFSSTASGSTIRSFQKGGFLGPWSTGNVLLLFSFAL